MKVKVKVLESFKRSSRELVNETKFFEALPFILFITFIAVIYISLSYKLERTQKSINQINGDLEEMRTEYIETQTKINRLSIQSEIVKKVSPYGLKEMTKSPRVILKK